MTVKLARRSQRLEPPVWSYRILASISIGESVRGIKIREFDDQLRNVLRCLWVNANIWLEGFQPVLDGR